MFEEKNLQKGEKTVLIGVYKDTLDKEIALEHMAELSFLARTLGLKEEKRFLQRMSNPHPKTYIGKGKVEEINEYVQASGADVVIFDDDLSPSQLKNLEKAFNCRIYDRSLLILDIFLVRAKTSRAKAQVELARYQYLLPRLTRMWTHLERQRGGTGTRGGAGEKEIETDRRILRDQIAKLKTKLEKIDKQMKTQRKSRGGIVRVSLVGYTNVGKSTLMNLMSKSSVKAEDKLFATVDSTVRKVYYDGIPFLLSDTVGFIRKLPHHLIESFKSTLDEIIEADILIHVVDLSHPNHNSQMEVVDETLKDLEASGKPVLLVYNKSDKVDREDIPHVGNDDSQVCISAGKKINIDEFKTKLMKMVEREHYRIYPNYLRPEIY